jgi:hypothetical protein
MSIKGTILKGVISYLKLAEEALVNVNLGEDNKHVPWVLSDLIADLEDISASPPPDQVTLGFENE